MAVKKEKGQANAPAPVSLSTVMSTKLQWEALQVADRDLEAFTRRHRMLSDICADIEEVREKIRQRRDELRFS